MTRVVIGGGHVDWPWRRDQPQLIEKLVDILDLGCELLASRLSRVVPVTSVVLEHGPATGNVDDHGVNIVGRKRPHVRIGELLSRFARAGVEMDGAAANLLPRHDDIATVLLQHACRGPIGRPKDRVAYTAGK